LTTAVQMPRGPPGNASNGTPAHSISHVCLVYLAINRLVMDSRMAPPPRGDRADASRRCAAKWTNMRYSRPIWTRAASASTDGHTAGR
jgi:hypothetical protein